MTKALILKLSLGILFVISLFVYGFYDKYQKEKLYEDFRANKKLQCGDTIVQRNKGWTIRGNRVFTNGKIVKTIIFCERLD